MKTALLATGKAVGSGFQVGESENQKLNATLTIPWGGGVVRHMVATPKGDLYLACSGVKKVGVVRIK